VQRLGGADGVSGGSPQFIEPLARAAVATGAVSTVFIETHPRVSEALSDRASMLPMERLEPLIESLVRIIETLDLPTETDTLSQELGSA
jgi:2-dehydro-3-deoxyphosphooctonate aldolase (KDO 8-P synthase)